MEDDFNFRILSDFEGFFEVENGTVVTVNRVTVVNGPARTWVVIEGGRDGETRLFECGFGATEIESVHLFLAIDRACFEAGQDEVSAIGRGQSSIGHPWVAQGIDFDGGVAACRDRGAEAEGGIDGRISDDEE